MRRCFSRLRMRSRFARVVRVSRPCSRSLPPRATTTTEVSGRMLKSTRAAPPAVVSPETPAPRTILGTPRRSSAR